MISRLAFHHLAVGLALVAGLFLAGTPARAEYADVVLNRYAEKEGMRPVIFPHWFHRIRFRCKVCHAELSFKMRAGSNAVKMSDIIDGRFCGACHNGEIAWSVENCDLCHSGKAGLPPGIFGGHETLGPGRW
ncbi:c(7)-type cytochrome triheme domain-containing protein [Aromatoleum evansii]|uniref:C(7)-type cytochrome triheme domain-containing protein n=1 Tax=Aromatoleum evansii TaxID=59406 RepID=A0ABZ1ALK2_AROEV|nr:c(7)-type cytochrome triheme domain-containing protein [Aromatoleum evansii]